MRLLNVLTFVTWAQAVFAGTSPTPQVTIAPRNRMDQKSRNGILDVVNNLRRGIAPAATNLTEITWDYELERDLQRAIAIRGGAVLYRPDPYFAPGPKYTYHLNDWGMYRLTEWPELVEKYGNSTGYITHDTCNNGKIVSIFKYRIPRQVKCFDFSSCSNSTYTNYDTCIKPSLRNTKTDKWGQMECAYATEFVFRLLWPFEKIACVYAGVPGPYTPNKQNNAFVCYYRNSKVLIFSNDIIYKPGPRASECTEPYPTPFKGLCTDKRLTAKPTRKPTNQPTIKPTRTPTERPTKRLRALTG